MSKVVVLTALQLEFKAVRNYLTNVQPVLHNDSTYEVGQFDDIEILIVEVDAGNSSAAAETTRAAEYFKPDVVAFVGVAGGIKDVAVGDVVVATKVYAYESGKESQEFQTRPEAPPTSYAYEQAAKSLARNESRVQEVLGVAPPSILVAPIAAGEKVVASKDSETFNLLKKNYSDTVAVEMESYGFLAACRMSEVRTLIVRGISDLIDGKTASDDEGWQEKAAASAAAVAFELLKTVLKPVALATNGPLPANPR